MRLAVTLVFYLAMLSPTMAQNAREQALEEFFTSLAEAATSGDRTAYAESFTTDAGMFLPHRPPLLGREQIGEWFDDFVQTVDLVLDSYEQEQIDIVGDVAMVRSRALGHYLVEATGEQLPFDQKYLDIVQYDDGRWRLAYHVANSSTFEAGLWDRDWESP